MNRAQLIPVPEINTDDEILNLGTVEKSEHFPTTDTYGFTITKGKCISAAFYWFRSYTKLWVIKAENNSQPPVNKI